MGNRYLSMQSADLKARDAASELIRSLEKFDAEHPDPTAAIVAAQLDYVTPNYLTQICASILAEDFLISPETRTIRFGDLELEMINKTIEMDSEIRPRRHSDPPVRDTKSAKKETKTK